MQRDGYDPARLRRAATRAVQKMGPGQFAVAGNEEPVYYVDLNQDPPCFCLDKQNRPSVRCLHELAARLHNGDGALIQALGDMLLKTEKIMEEV